jgi:hypothetical protein
MLWHLPQTACLGACCSSSNWLVVPACLADTGGMVHVSAEEVGHPHQRRAGLLTQPGEER